MLGISHYVYVYERAHRPWTVLLIHMFYLRWAIVLGQSGSFSFFFFFASLFFLIMFSYVSYSYI